MHFSITFRSPCTKNESSTLPLRDALILLSTRLRRQFRGGLLLRCYIASVVLPLGLVEVILRWIGCCSLEYFRRYLLWSRKYSIEQELMDRRENIFNVAFDAFKNLLFQNCIIHRLWSTTACCVQQRISICITNAALSPVQSAIKHSTPFLLLSAVFSCAGRN